MTVGGRPLGRGTGVGVRRAVLRESNGRFAHGLTDDSQSVQWSHILVTRSSTSETECSSVNTSLLSEKSNLIWTGLDWTNK